MTVATPSEIRELQDALNAVPPRIRHRMREHGWAAGLDDFIVLPEGARVEDHEPGQRFLTVDDARMALAWQHSRWHRLRASLSSLIAP